MRRRDWFTVALVGATLFIGLMGFGLVREWGPTMSSTTSTLAPFVAPLTTTAPIPPTTTSVAPTTTTAPLPTTTTAPDVTTLPDWPLWRTIGRCEQPGHGVGGINWTHRDRKYPGGLGMLIDNYRVAARVLGLPMNAWDATPFQQVLAARFHRYGDAHHRAHGLDGWGCAYVMGILHH